MAKGDRWWDNQDVEVREMRSAETVLGVILQDKNHWRAAVRSKDSCPVRRGAVGKGLRKRHLAGRLPYRPPGSMSGEWKRSKVRLLRHRQPKGPATDRPSLNHRVTPRLYYTDLKLNCCIGCRPKSSAPPVPFTVEETL